MVECRRVSPCSANRRAKELRGFRANAEGSHAALADHPLRRAPPLAGLGLSLLAPAPTSPDARPLERISHLIVIYQENWGFDGLFGKFPGANGLANAGATVRQVDKSGRP